MCGRSVTVVAPFRHEALLYDSQPDFLAGTLEFIIDGLSRDEPVLVMLVPDKIDLLREDLGEDADRVAFANMAKVGANPARIIPAWAEFAAEYGGRGPFRGIGEPIWAGRSGDELVECQRHESLLNLAFAGADDFRLLCPYDIGSLPGGVIEEAYRSHPRIVVGTADLPSTAYGEPTEEFDAPLEEPDDVLGVVRVEYGRLGLIRWIVRRHAGNAGLTEQDVDSLVLATTEVATNTLVHAGGTGELRVWRNGATLVCEVRDKGHIDDPLVGRVSPADGEGGRGVWLAMQLCDLVQVRTSGVGNVVRLHMRAT